MSSALAALRSLRALAPRALTPARFLHHSLPTPPIPAPTTTVPDVPTFLQKIGRDTHQHASKFETWEQFFGLTSQQLKALGIEPARTRRYILRWRETFRMSGGLIEPVEQKRGRKIDGGERRRKDIRAKRNAKLRKERREELAKQEGRA